MHPSLLGYVSLGFDYCILFLVFIFPEYSVIKDEILREEEYDTNDFLYSKLRNAEALAVYALGKF